MTNQSQNIINHVSLILDASYSMSFLKESLIQVVDNQIKNLANLSKDLDQETRISIYVFSDNVTNLVFDKDVLRLPSIKNLYKIQQNTALIDGVIKGIEDLKQTCQLYGEHSFLVYCLTDGEENRSKAKSSDLSSIINNLPDNWTIAAFVPNQNGKFYAEKYGFPKDNIAIWSTDTAGMDGVGDQIQKTTQSYMHARSVGARSVKNLFSLKTEKLTSKEVKKSLTKLKSSDFSIIPNISKTAVEIKGLIESNGRKYNKDGSFYQLVKVEHIQDYKRIVLQDKSNGDVYSGIEARKILGLPDNQEVKVAPVNHDKYNIFIQSTAQNRRIIPNSSALVLH